MNIEFTRNEIKKVDAREYENGTLAVTGCEKLFICVDGVWHRIDNYCEHYEIIYNVELVTIASIKLDKVYQEK